MKVKNGVSTAKMMIQLCLHKIPVVKEKSKKCNTIIAIIIGKKEEKETMHFVLQKKLYNPYGRSSYRAPKNINREPRYTPSDP